MYMENWNPFSTSTKVHSCLSLEAKNECTWKKFTIKIVTHQRLLIVVLLFSLKLQNIYKLFPSFCIVFQSEWHVYVKNITQFAARYLRLAIERTHVQTLNAVSSKKRLQQTFLFSLLTWKANEKLLWKKS